MLGIRLSSELEQKLSRYAHTTRRTKSDIARDAVEEYLRRHADEDEFKRQVVMLNAPISREEYEELEASTDEWLRMLDEEDGGYDWGEDGPPR